MMISNTPLARISSRTAAPSTFASETREAFARAVVFAEFGYRHGRAIDYADFVDRQPGLAPFGKIAGRIVQRLAEEREAQNGSR